MARFVGIKFGEIELKIEVPEGMSLRDACAEIGVSLEGQTVLINGIRLSDREAQTATIKDTDEVEMVGKTSAGRH